jgi:hypothetical protein
LNAPNDEIDQPLTAAQVPTCHFIQTKYHTMVSVSSELVSEPRLIHLCEWLLGLSSAFTQGLPKFYKMRSKRLMFTHMLHSTQK